MTSGIAECDSASCSPRLRLVLVVVSIGSGINLLGLPVTGCVLERLLLAVVSKGWGVNRRFVCIVVSTGSGVNFRLVFIVVSTGSALKHLGRVDEDIV